MWAEECGAQRGADVGQIKATGAASIWRAGFLMAIGLLCGCTTANDPVDGINVAATQPATETAFADPAVPGPSLTQSDYRIGPRDVLEVSVFQVPDLDRTVQVGSGGQIVLPLIGAVTAADRTVAELQDDIAAKLGAKYLQSPQVSVFVKDALSQQVTVEGAVNKPGIYPTGGNATLLQVIALAGGLNRVADGRGVVVFRQVNGKRNAAVFDFAAVQAGRDDDPAVYGGDVVVVDQSGLKATMRNIRESVGVLGLFVPLI
jgi:polysaccharide export outer membrane protein